MPKGRCPWSIHAKQTKKRVDGEKLEHQNALSHPELGAADVEELLGPEDGEIGRIHHRGLRFGDRGWRLWRGKDWITGLDGGED